MNGSKNFNRKTYKNLDGNGHIWGGAFILLIGVAALAKSFVADLDWLFSWQMFLIALGCFIGLRNKFRGGTWLILILIGSFFLIENYFVMDYSFRKRFWPLALIVLGTYLIFRPRRKSIFSNNKEDIPVSENAAGPNYSNISTSETSIPVNSSETTPVTEEILDVVAVFSGVKKNIYSKNFKGGEIVSVFGGAEINLTQAGFQQQQIEIESVQIFGGAKLIVPSDWVIHNEATAIFGGIEDKRQQPVALPVPAKILVLKGFVMFGGIEIKSY